jgi:hypothetical protein
MQRSPMLCVVCQVRTNFPLDMAKVAAPFAGVEYLYVTKGGLLYPAELRGLKID